MAFLAELGVDREGRSPSRVATDRLGADRLNGDFLVSMLRREGFGVVKKKLSTDRKSDW